MIIHFGGEFQVKKTAEEVYAFLTDPERFCPLLPDFQGMKKEDGKHFIVTLRVGISHIRGNAALRMALEEAEPSRHALYSGKGEVPGGSVTMKASFDLAADSGGTKVLWKGEAQIAGRLPSLAGGLLEPLAKKNLQKLIDALQAALA